MKAIMRQKVETAIEKLDYDFSQYTTDSLTAHLEKQRGRRIEVAGLDLSYKTSGAYVQAPKKDFIFYNMNRNKFMQIHAILHEFGHMILEHDASTLIVDDESDAIFEIIKILSLRCHFRIQHEVIFSLPSNRNEESEAELFVRLINGYRFTQYRHDEIRRNNNITLLPPFIFDDNENSSTTT